MIVMTGKRLACAFAALCLLTYAAAAFAENEKPTKETERVQAAVATMNEISNIPENTIPEAMMRRAAGVAIIPNVIKAGFVVGGKHGNGVLCVREKDGTWSRPVFVGLTGGSIGWQVGVEATDVVLVFMRKQNINDVLNGEFTLGGDASVAAGPVGRKAAAATSDDLDSEIYSYSRSRGAFAGLAIDGSKLYVDKGANAAFYTGKKTNPEAIVYGKELTTPPAAKELMEALDAYPGSAKKQGEMKEVKKKEY
jgi:lipid-binding SYLF domain-containing protein